MKNTVLILFMLASVMYGQSKVGSTAASFLGIGVGPRAISMGGAFTATADDPSALYWNPAGIARMDYSGAMFSHSEWFVGINYQWAGAVLNLGNAGSLGLNLTYLDYGDIEVTTHQEPNGTGELYSPSDMSIGLTYAYNLTDRFSLGGTVKYVRETIWNASANTVAVDLGVLFRSDIYGLRIAAAISNFGGNMQMDGSRLYIQYDIDESIEGNNDQILARLNTNEFPIPLTFRIGLAMDVIERDDLRFTLAADALHPNDNDESVNVGGELELYNLVVLRGGYKSLFLDRSEEGLTLGVGLKHDFGGGIGFSLDYAYQDFGILDYTQHFGVGVRF